MQRAPFSSLALNLSRFGTEEYDDAAGWLQNKLPIWRSDGVNSVWLTASLPQHASLIGRLTQPQTGFVVHHASGLEVTLLKWLPETISKVPPFGGTQVGVGGVVVDEKGRLLVVRERSAKHSMWKFPGGLANIGEDIGAAAVRETWEETGVKSTFCGLLGLRHAHGVGWGMSDIYFLALLRPALCGDDDDAPIPINIDPHEIAEASWHDGEKFASETVHPMLEQAARLALRAAKSVPGSTQPFWQGSSLQGTSVLPCHEVYLSFAKRYMKMYFGVERVDKK
jgi:ADP-ribose pyrophosphatase YjhB (NUDIX family)